MHQPLPTRRLLAAASLLLAMTPFAAGQSLDITPAYHPDGPVATGGRRIEFHSGDFVTVRGALDRKSVV